MPFGNNDPFAGISRARRRKLEESGDCNWGIQMLRVIHATRRGMLWLSDSSMSLAGEGEVKRSHPERAHVSARTNEGGRRLALRPFFALGRQTEHGGGRRISVSHPLGLCSQAQPASCVAVFRRIHPCRSHKTTWSAADSRRQQGPVSHQRCPLHMPQRPH